LPLSGENAAAAPIKEAKKSGKKSRKNKKWIALYAVTIVLWFVVFTITVRSWLIGTEAVVDTLDISLFTYPFLAFNLVFVAATFLIFGAYFGYYRAAVRRQTRALCKPAVGDTELASGAIKNRDGSANPKSGELCSIIIPARDEESVIKNTILSCLAQSYGNIEVIIVCHNCSDNTYGQARSIVDGRVRAFELKTSEAGKGIALNYGVQKAGGKYVLVLDGDGRLNHTFIEDAIPLFGVDDYAAVQGRYIPSNRNYNFVTRMLALEGDLWSTPFMTLRNIGKKRTPLGGTGYIIRKDILLEVGGFANHLVDDYELTFRLLRHNYQIVYAPLCINYDEKPPDLNIMLNQRARWLRGFLNLTKSRVAEPRDVIGNLFWVNPLTAFTGFALLLIAAYSTIHYLAFLYYPFHYSYIPLTIWFAITSAIFGLYTAALVMQYGKSGFKYAAWLPIYLPFSNYYMIVAIKAFFVKSWAETKTTHGYAAENIQGSQSTVLKERGG
jgi:cellulose synthase/poly-beta-1,6-N-acetylglucosamine synthase-like glycosyltransferase